MTSSDHRLLIATIAFPARLQYCPPQANATTCCKTPCQQFPNSILYQLTLWEKLRTINQADWDATSAAIQEAAHETLRQEVKPKNNRQFVTDDPEISELSRKQKEMKLQKVAHGIMVNNIAGNKQVSWVSGYLEGQFKYPNVQDGHLDFMTPL